MQRSRNEILADVVELVPTVRDEVPSVDDGEITENTLLLADLGWGSLEVVILANAMQERYEQLFPFIGWFQDLGRQGREDISVGEWVDFVHAHLDQKTAPSGTGLSGP